MKRLINATELAEYLGVSQEYLRLWRLEKDFPKPVRGRFWDIKAIEQYLDKLSGLTTNSSELDYESIFKEDLNGGHKDGLFHHSHP